MEVILNLVDFEMGIQEAVNAPRVHHQWLPDRIRIEADGATSEAVMRLEEMGHTVQMGGQQGSANSGGIDPDTGERVGAPDPRSPDSGARGR